MSNLDYTLKDIEKELENTSHLVLDELSPSALEITETGFLIQGLEIEEQQ
jgi:hypothetical protein